MAWALLQGGQVSQPAETLKCVTKPLIIQGFFMGDLSVFQPIVACCPYWATVGVLWRAPKSALEKMSRFLSALFVDQI